MSLADNVTADMAAREPEPSQPRLTVDAGPDGGEFTGLVTTEPIQAGGYEGAFAKVYALAGLSASDYRIVDDTVRFSAWEQSARSANGDRDKVTLYSYRARFARITPQDVRTEALVKELAAHIKARTLPRRTPGTGLEPPSTYTVMFSDWQFGKPATRPEDDTHGTTGVEQTSWRVMRAIDASVERVKALRKAGRNITGITLAHMGDPTENVADSYESQTFGIELNLTQQIEVALRHMVAGAETLLPLADDEAHMLFVLCNHGQLARRGTKSNITDDADNVQNHLATLLRDYIVGPKMPDVQWHIPGQEMITTTTLAGVPVAAAHGHKISGNEDTWLLRQTAMLTAARQHTPRLWLTAHKHSLDVRDLGSITRVQASTADGGSKHFTDGSGVYATPGTTTLVIGRHNERGYSDLELL